MQPVKFLSAKASLLAAFCVLVAGPILAEETNASWLTSAPTALAQAKKENKLVLLDFTGSDWCVGCMHLEKDVFTKPEFFAYAKTNLVLVEVDFPLKKKQPAALVEANNALQEKYGVQGYPTLLVLKPDGTVIWKREGYLPGGPAAVISQINAANKK